jgi:ribokinase
MNDPRFDILSYGTLGIDHILRVPHWPGPDVSTHTLSEAVHLGGKATNTAANLAAWGLRVAISGTSIGDDTTALQFFDLVAQHPSIDTRYIRRCEGQVSMYCLIFVNPQGERAIVGVNADQVAAAPPTQEMIADAGILTLDLYGGSERVEAARLAANLDRQVVIGDLRDSDHPVLKYTTVAIVSAAEIRLSYPGRSIKDFAARVLNHGPRVVIVTDGGNMVSVFTGDTETRLTPPEIPIVDTTGAGDAVRAGVTFGIYQGLGPVECAALGIAAGSISVQEAGAVSSPPSKDAVQSMAEAILRTAIRL